MILIYSAQMHPATSASSATKDFFKLDAEDAKNLLLMGIIRNSINTGSTIYIAPGQGFFHLIKK